MSLHRPSGQKMSVFFTWLFLSRNFREILRLFSGTRISCISAGSNDIFTKIDIFKKKCVRQINVHSTTRASDLFYMPGKLRQIHPRGCHYDQIFRKVRSCEWHPAQRKYRRQYSGNILCPIYILQVTAVLQFLF